MTAVRSEVAVRETLRSAALGATKIRVHAAVRETLRSTITIDASKRPMSLM